MSELKNKRSELWKHFQIVGEGKAKCGYCNKIISFRGGATGNLGRHMKSVHKAISLEKAIYRHQAENDEEMEDQPQNMAATVSRNTPSTSYAPSVNIPSTLSAPNDDTPSASSAPVSVTQNRTVPNKKNVPSHSQDVITNFIRRPISINKSKQLDEQLIRVIVKEYQPFRVVEDPEFKKFIHMLNPNYNMPDRKTISNSFIPKMFNNIKEVVLKKMVRN